MTRACGAVHGGAPLSPKRLVRAAVAAALVLTAPVAVAEEAGLPDAGTTFEYALPREKYYLRATLEELGLLGLGLLHYFANQDINSVDWDLAYDWPSMRAKLVGDAYAFDTNLFETNFVSHPAAGLLYYVAARGNRLSVLESLGFAFASSTIWELAGEYRELVSVNDVIVTPFSGFTLGESTNSIGAFFDRSCESTTNSVLGSIFGFSKSLHDAIDDAELARAKDCDRFGLSTAGGHRFELAIGNAAVFSESDESPSGEMRLSSSAEVLHLNELGRPGRGWQSFSDGNVSSLYVSLSAAAERVTDLTVGARTVPFGLHYRDLAGRKSATVRGAEAVVGFLVGSEYSQHRYGRPAGKLDRFFVLDLPATTVTVIVRRGSRRLELGLDGGAVFGGASAFALEDYRAGASNAGLSSVTQRQGYSHAAGFALAPRARLVLDGAELGFRSRIDRLYGFRVLDRSSSDVGVPVHEARRRGTLWLAFGPPSFPRVVLFVDGLRRSGTVNEAKSVRRELAIGASLQAVF
jgi:hypothetical protein